MNILVTGGAGFIGSNFIHQRLKDKQSEVKHIVNLDCLTYSGNLDNLVDLDADPRYKFIQGDICDNLLVSQILAENKIDAVVNFAAESHVDRSIDSPEPFFRTNVIGTVNLLNSANIG